MVTPETATLLCVANTLTLGTGRYPREQRIDALRLTSADNAPLMKSLHPEIVTIDSDYTKVRRQVACQLTAQVTGRSEPQRIITPTTLS